MEQQRQQQQHSCLSSTHKFYAIFIITFTMVSHFAAALFTGFMIYTARPGSSLFSWHPTLMTTAFALLMFEAILVFSPESSLLQKYSRAVKVEVHWILQTLAGILGGTGFAIIYVNKEISEKPHFTTWHGLLGLVTVVYVVVQSLGGALVKYPEFAKGFKRAQLKLYHATSGLCLFSLVCGTIALGLFSNWFTRNVTGTPWYACVGCVSVIVLSVMNQVVTAYQPRRQNVR